MKNYTENDIEELIKNNSIELFDGIRYTNKDSYKEIIKKICKKNEIDYFDLAYQALSKDANSYNLGNVLVDLIPYSKVNIDNILKLYELLYSKESGTSIHFKITKSLVANNNILAKELLEKLFIISKPFTIPHISAILIELHNSYNESQYETIITFLEDDNFIKLKSAIGYIHQFNFSDKELKNIFELFKEKVKLSNKEIDRELLYSSYDLVEKNYEYFSEIILYYIDRDNIDIKSNISQILFYARKNYIEKDWFQKSFLSIIDIDIVQQNIIYHIESILNSYLENNNLKFIKKFLYKWIEKGNLSSIYSETTLSLFTPKFNEHKLFSKFITESLVYENSELHNILSKLIVKNIKLDIDTMKNFTFDDYLYVCRKILGYFYKFDKMNTMIFSILSVNNLSKKVEQLVIDILVNYIGKDYPSDTLKYFKKLDESKLNESKRRAKNIIISILEKRNEEIKNLPKLKELLPSSQQNRIISRVNNMAMAKAMKKSRKEDSFLSMISTEIPLCCGRGMFSEFNGNFTDITYMQKYSHSITIPIASRTHPISYELERYNLRIVKKGQ